MNYQEIINTVNNIQDVDYKISFLTDDQLVDLREAVFTVLSNNRNINSVICGYCGKEVFQNKLFKLRVHAKVQLVIEII